ncbi:MAG: hypothetical protein GC161_19460 [Planctomycetaceae bacterium]|nr:hypothetical protein [Planctomycetaceae bacterium]
MRAPRVSAIGVAVLAAVLAAVWLLPAARPAAQSSPAAPPPTAQGPVRPLPVRAAPRAFDGAAARPHLPPLRPLDADRPAPRPLRCLGPVAQPEVADGALALARAQDLERILRDSEGRERLAARLDCIDAWRALGRRADAADGAAAEAAMRAARHLAVLECVAEARAELEFVAANGGPGRAHLARLELGHLERRAGRHGPALVAYEAVERDALAPTDKRDAAALWRGRVHAERGQRDDAARLWGALLEHARDPVTRVRAGDWLALDALARGDGAEAAGWIARTRERAFEVSLERTPEGARVRRALARMRSLVELALAAEDGQVGRDVLFGESGEDDP